MLRVIVSAGFSEVYCNSGPKGIIEPDFTNTGILSYGASAMICCPPSYHFPEYRSYHPADLGKYTERLVCLYSQTGLISREGPNINWLAIFNTAVSFPKSITSPRIMV